MSTSSEEKAAANKLETMRKAVHDFLHEKNAFTSVFELAEKYTKVDRKYIFLGLLAVLGLYLVVGYGAGLVVNLLGFVYPAYKSIKAINSEEKDDDTQWLTYWVVYSVFSVLEFFTDILLSWVPFYFLLKCAFLIWCMFPITNNGAAIIYHRIIKPFVAKHEKEIEGAIGMGARFARDAGKKATAVAKEAAGHVDLRQLQEIHDTITSDKPEKQD